MPQLPRIVHLRVDGKKVTDFRTLSEYVDEMNRHEAMGVRIKPISARLRMQFYEMQRD